MNVGGNAEIDQPIIVLVHGAWHGAAHWSRVQEALSAAGVRSAAVDLPGSGAHVELPRSYQAQDLSRLSTEPSPLAHITLQDQVDVVKAELDRQRSRGPVIVVAHSAGGLAVTAALEQDPALASHAIYVAAHCPVALPNMLGYLGTPESTGGGLDGAFMGDPSMLGAVRINPRAVGANYRDTLRMALYNDLNAAQARPFIEALTPDFPLRVASDEVRVTAQRWGRVRRSFVRTLADRALPLRLQDRMITEADALTPANRFQVHSLNTGHSPFASQPQALAALLLAAR